MTEQILFDRLRYLDRLKEAGVAEGVARAHADAMELALRDSVVTKGELHIEIGDLRTEIVRLDHKIDLAVRELTIRMGVIGAAIIAILSSLKFFLPPGH